MFKLLVGTALTLLTWDNNKIFASENIIGIIPHFIGFFLILLGVRDMEKKSQFFERVMLPSYVLLFYSLAYYLMKAFGLVTRIGNQNEFVVYFIDLAEAIGTLFVVYLVIFALTNYEHKKRWEIGCKRLQKFWKIMTFTYIFYYIAYITNAVTNSGRATDDIIFPTVMLQLGFGVIKNGAIILFLWMFYRTWAAYEEKLAE